MGQRMFSFFFFSSFSIFNLSVLLNCLCIAPGVTEMVGLLKRLGTAHLGIYHGDRLVQGMGARAVKNTAGRQGRRLGQSGTRAQKNAKLFQAICTVNWLLLPFLELMLWPWFYGTGLVGKSSHRAFPT